MTLRNPTPLANLLTKLSSHMRPDFLIIGAQKCGTTALYMYLSHHKQIVSGRCKEIHFFDQDANYRKGSFWYHLHFPHVDEITLETLAFEATPYYLYYPPVAQRIYEYDPHLKLIILLRNPVDRAYSAWNMFRRLAVDGTVQELLETIQAEKQSASTRIFADINPEARDGLLRFFLADGPQSFAEATKKEIEQIEAGVLMPYPNFVHCGLYVQQLERYLTYFKRQQIHIIDSQRLRTNPVQILDEVTQFLNLPDHDWRQENLAETRAAYQSPVDKKTRRWLQAFYQPYNEQLYELVEHDFNWH